MDVDSISRSPIGNLAPIRGTDRWQRQYDHFAYVPDPLPTTLVLDQATWLVVADAAAALARLDQASGTLPDARLIRRPSIRREAQSTSELEGTFAPLEDVLRADATDDKSLSLEMVEILNYERAAERAFGWVEEGRPLTVGLLEALQGDLVRGTPSAEQDAGRVRERQVVIGDRTGRVENARFVPPPSGAGLRASLGDLLSWLDNSREVHPLVRLALAHYQFETLHPFADGNGRIGRLVVALQVLRDGILREPLIEISPWLVRRRTEYQDELFGLSVTGDHGRWTRFFLSGISAQALEAVRRIERLGAFQARTRETIRALRIRGVAAQIADDLIGMPFVRIAQAARDYNVSYPGARKALHRLEEVGVVERFPAGATYNQTFVAREVVRIIAGPDGDG